MCSTVVHNVVLKFGFRLRVILLLKNIQENKLFSRSDGTITIPYGEVKLLEVRVECVFLPQSPSYSDRLVLERIVLAVV